MNTQNTQNSPYNENLDSQDTPYVEDKALTWQSMTKSSRAAVSAGIVAVGATVVFGPAMPVMAQIFGISQSLPGLADEADAATIPTGLPNTAANAGQAANAGSQGQLATSTASNGANIDPASINLGAGGVNASTVNSTGQGTSGTQVQPKLQLPQTKLNFGNTSSATPSAGGTGSSGQGGNTGWSGEREKGEHGDRGEYEGEDD